MCLRQKDQDRMEGTGCPGVVFTPAFPTRSKTRHYCAVNPRKFTPPKSKCVNYVAVVSFIVVKVSTLP